MKSSVRVAVVALLGVAGAGCNCGPTIDLPTINLSSTQAQDGRISVTIEPGGPSVKRDVTINNTSACSLSYTAAVEDQWLSVSPATGTISPNGSTTVTVTISSGDSAGLLPLGSFLGTVVISATCSDTVATVAGSPAAVAIQVTIATGDAGRNDAGLLDAGSGDAG